MSEKCEICGATENIQEHHISYEPEIKQFLCVTCHEAVHNHGVGNPKGWSTQLFEILKTDVKILFKAGATNGEVARACDISMATASHWRKKLGLAVKKYLDRDGRKTPMPKVVNMGIGEKGEVWWETNVPANNKIGVPIRLQRLGAFKKGEKIKVFIKKKKANKK